MASPGATSVSQRSKGWVTGHSTGKQRLLGVLGPVPVDPPVTKPFEQQCQCSPQICPSVPKVENEFHTHTQKFLGHPSVGVSKVGRGLLAFHP